jgi:branched-chain amino acid transport system substrate-binding protein
MGVHPVTKTAGINAATIPATRKPTELRRNQMTAKTKLALLAATAALAIASGGAAQAGSVKVAQISTISGGFPFGDVVKGTQSYFNLVNAAGGVNGTTFEFMAGDDKGQASESAQLARKFVLQDGVVAFIGNTSLSDCPANTAFYESKKILAIGGGTQTTCFTTPNWIPVNTGPYIGHLANWQYVFEVLKPEKVCAIEQNDPTSVETYDKMYKWIQEVLPSAKGKFTAITYTNDASQNPIPAVTAAKQAGCDLITLSTVAPNAVAFVKAAQAVAQ